MKKIPHLFIFIFFFTLSVKNTYAQVDNLPTDKYELLLMSGTVHPVENSKDVSVLKPLANEIVNGNYYRIIQFKKIPSDQEKQELKTKGIDLLVYLPNYAFFAAISQRADLSTINSIRSILPVLPEYKIHPSLKNNKLPKQAEVVKGKADLVITVFKGIPSTVIINELKKKIIGINILSNDEASQTLTVRLKKGKTNEIAKLSFVQYIEPIDPYVIENNSGTSGHRSNTINSYLPTGLHYDGTGVGVSIGDGGPFYSHVDFTGRQTGGVTTNPADHATHVTGIVGGAGNIDPRYRGQAPGATLLNSNGFADIQSVASITTLYNGANNIRVTNHSLGEAVNAGYTSTARMSDLQVASLSSIFNVHSAGNSGSGWNTITGGYKAGKNAIATGNLDYKDLISSSSSRGPSADGRIKPDICAKGSSVYSTMPSNVYNTMSGTSMASPGAAGCFAQLIHAYRTLNNNNDPKLAQLKAIVLNTAEDLGNAGPDFTYGWGRINVLKAYNAIVDQRYFSSTITNGTTKTHTISVPSNVTEVKVMVYWADPAAAAGVSKALINDLDITLTSSSQTYDPWKLNKTSPTTAAVRGVDNDNNMEQVSVSNPATGTYTLNIAGTLVPQGPQEYWVTYEYIKNEITVTYPMGGDFFVPGETEYIRWDAAATTGNFTIEYSSNGGTSWTTLSSSVSAAARYYAWTVPSGITGQALIRVSRNSISDVSDASFNIIPVPTNLKVTARCPGNFTMSWNAVAGATQYEVFALGTKYMVSQGTTPSLSLTVNIPNTSVTWASVRALANNGQVIGRRAIAIQVATTQTNCVVAAPSSNFAASTTTICTGTPVTFNDQSINSPTSWSWSFPGGTPSSSTVQNPSITYAASGTYTVTLQSANTTGTSTPVTKTITVNATPTVAASNATICSGNAATLSASGATTYNWTTGATTSSVSVSPSTTTNYTVTGTTNGCINKKTVSVTVKATPTVAVSNSTICSGNSATLSAGGATTYNWNTGATTSNISVTPTTTTNYTVTGTTNGCTNTKTVSVTVNQKPSVTLGSVTSPLCVNSTPVTLSGTPSGGVFSGPGVSGSTFNPSTSGAGTFTINYNYTDVNNCSNTANQSLVVSLCTNILELNGSFASVFPNPVKNEVTINLDNDLINTSTVELFDAVGKLVMSEKMENKTNTFQVSHLTNGMYILRIKSKSYQKQITIIKE